MTTADSSRHPSHPPHNAHVILVVDDALDSLRMLCDALAAEGYVVLAARDADEALQRFALTVPDGVLLDAVMPGMDGFTLCRTLKATPAWAHVPVVFMTGLSDTDQIIRGFASGGVDYVVKPLRIPEVLVRLATHAGSQAVPGTPAVVLLPQRPLQVRAEINESFAAAVREGMRATVTLDADGAAQQQLPSARVLRISPVYGTARLQDDQQRGPVRVIECVLVFEQAPAAAVRVGQNVRVQFHE